MVTPLFSAFTTGADYAHYFDSLRTTHLVIPAKAGIQSEDYPAQRTKPLFRPASRGYFKNWIPAYAGMTGV
jgi:hypothetical protein